MAQNTCICDVGYYADKIDQNQCKTCEIGCKSCIEIDHCVICDLGLIN
jgi:hypothetical protein